MNSKLSGLENSTVPKMDWIDCF